MFAAIVHSESHERWADITLAASSPHIEGTPIAMLETTAALRPTAVGASAGCRALVGAGGSFAAVRGRSIVVTEVTLGAERKRDLSRLLMPRLQLLRTVSACAQTGEE